MNSDHLQNTIARTKQAIHELNEYVIYAGLDDDHADRQLRYCSNLIITACQAAGIQAGEIKVQDIGYELHHGNPLALFAHTMSHLAGALIYAVRIESDDKDYQKVNVANTQVALTAALNCCRTLLRLRKDGMVASEAVYARS